VNEPKFVALVNDTFIEEGDSLPDLVNLLRELAVGAEEDVAIWDQGRLVGILLASSGVYVSLEGERRAEAVEAAADFLKRRPKS
jgi:hypothetical protein